MAPSPLTIWMRDHGCACCRKNSEWLNKCDDTRLLTVPSGLPRSHSLRSESLTTPHFDGSGALLLVSSPGNVSGSSKEPRCWSLAVLIDADDGLLADQWRDRQDAMCGRFRCRIRRGSARMCKSSLLQTSYAKTVSRLRQPESSVNSPPRGRQQAAWPKYPHGHWIITRSHRPLAQKCAGSPSVTYPKRAALVRRSRMPWPGHL